MKRWLPFLIVNIIVSAATTLLVLTLWNKNNSTSTINIESPTSTAPLPANPASDVVLPPLDTPVIKVSNVFAAGDLQNELLVIERIGEGDLNLIGWQIIDQDNNQFTFPAMDLVKGQVSIYSRNGSNTVNTLFWGSDKAIWSTGEVIIVLDSAGQERARFEIP